MNYLKGKYTELQIEARDKAQVYKKRAVEKQSLKVRYEEELQRGKLIQSELNRSKKKLEEYIEPLK